MKPLIEMNDEELEACIRPHCLTCKFWAASISYLKMIARDSSVIPGDRRFDCRKKSPDIPAAPTCPDGPGAEWPTTRRMEWCGDYQRSPLIDLIREQQKRRDDAELKRLVDKAPD